MESNFPKETLNFFYNNFNSLKIVYMKNDPILLENRITGSYNVLKNKISILEGSDECTLIHELFHMASSCYDGKIDTIFSGFEQKNSTISMGKGINEGYTELLTRRYTKKISRSYLYQIYIASIIEQIIGIDKMQELYLSGHLYSLIKELSKYIVYDEVINFIQSIDIYTNNESKKDKIVIESLEVIEKFLLQVQLKKLKEDLATLNPDENVEIYIYKRLANILSNNYVSKRMLSFVEIQNYIKEILGINITINIITVGALKAYYEKQTKRKISSEETTIFNCLTYYNIYEQQIYEILRGNFKSINDELSLKMKKNQIEDFYYAINEIAKIKFYETNEYSQVVEKFIVELKIKELKILYNFFGPEHTILKIKEIYSSIKFLSNEEFKQKVKKVLNMTVIFDNNNNLEITDLNKSLAR